MKFFVKFFENYGAMMTAIRENNVNFAELEGALKMQILEKEFEYGRLKVWFNTALFDANYACFANKCIVLGVNLHDENSEIKIIFSGILEKIVNISNKITVCEYIAKPQFLEGTSLEISQLTRKNFDGNRKLNGGITKNKFWFCDKVTHNFSKVNLKNNHDYINICKEQILNLSQIPIKTDRIDCVNLRIKFCMSSYRIFKEDIYRKIAEKFDGETLSAKSLIDNVRKNVVFATNINVLLQNFILKCIKIDEIVKKIDDNIVTLYRSKIYGSICLLCWQNVLKNVELSLKILQNKTKSDAKMMNCRFTTISLPMDELVHVSKWMPNQYYDANDVVFVEKRYIFCNNPHKSRQNFDDKERQFWSGIDCKTNTFFVCDENAEATYSEVIIAQIQNVIGNVCNFLLMKTRNKIVKIRVKFEDAMQFSVNSWIKLDDIHFGKIVQISHLFERNSAYSDIFIGINCRKDFDEKDTIFSSNEEITELEDILGMIEDFFKKEKMMHMFIGDTVVRDVKIQNPIAQQQKIVDKNYTKLDDFCRDFAKLKTKISIDFCKIKPIIYQNHGKNLGTVIIG